MSDNSFKKARLDYNIGSIDFNNIIDPIILFENGLMKYTKLMKKRLLV